MEVSAYQFNFSVISMFNHQKLCLTLHCILIQSPDSGSLQATYLNFFYIIFPNIYWLPILPVPLMFPTAALYVFLAALYMANVWTNLTRFIARCTGKKQS